MDIEKIHNITVDGATSGPKFCDAYFDSAEWEDGTPLTDEELEKLAEEYPDVLYEKALDAAIGKADALMDAHRDRDIP